MKYGGKLLGKSRVTKISKDGITKTRFSAVLENNPRQVFDLIPLNDSSMAVFVNNEQAGYINLDKTIDGLPYGKGGFLNNGFPSAIMVFFDKEGRGLVTMRVNWYAQYDHQYKHLMQAYNKGA